MSEGGREVEEVLRFSYYGGARCPGSGHSRVVNVYFQCDKGSGAVSCWEGGE